MAKLDPFVVGREVEQVVVDHAFSLNFGGGFVLQIENAFDVTSPDGSIGEFDPTADRSLLGPLLTLHAQSVTDGRIDQAGALEFAFTDGRVLRAHSDDRYESWHLGGPSGVIYTCLAGGDVAVWGSPRRLIR